MLKPPRPVSKNIVFLFTNGCFESHKKDQISVSICFTTLLGMLTTSAKNPTCVKTSLVLTTAFQVSETLIDVQKNESFELVFSFK